MLIRYWQWTSAAGNAVTSLPYGPLRYRAWTSGTLGSAGVTSVPFGPLRYRAWTNGLAITPPVVEGPFGTPYVFRIDLAGYRRILRDDEEIVAFLAALLASGALH